MNNKNNNYSKNPIVTPYDRGHRLSELILLLKKGLEQRLQEKLRNRGHLES